MKRTMILLVMAASASLAQAPRILTISEAVDLGLQSSRSVKMSSARASADRARADEATAVRFPSLSVLGGYTRIEDGTFRLSTANLPQPLPVGNVVVDNYLLRLGLRQPLFTGFRLSGASDAAQLRADASELDVARMTENVEFAVTAAYWSLYQNREVLRSATQNVKRLESYREDMKQLVESGLMTTNDQLKVEVQYSNSQIARLEARDAARLAEIDLNILLGLTQETPIELASRPGESALRDTLSADTSLSRLIDAAAEHRVESAHAGVQVARGVLWPQIELTANYQYNNPNSRYQPITPEFLGTWDVGVSLAFELWNWGATGSRIEQAKAALHQAELARQDVRESLSREVQEAALAVRRAHEKIALARLVLSQAQENLRSESDRYASGLASSTNLLDAEVSLVNAEMQSSGAEVEYALSRAALARALGTQHTRETRSR